MRVLAFFAGGALSFLGLGLLWIGRPAWEAGAAALFALAAWFFSRRDARPRESLLALACGAAPLGFVLTLFRDRSDSHRLPVLIVLSWAAGIAAGGLPAVLGRSAQEDNR